MWFAKTEIASLDYPRLLRKGKKNVLNALNGIFVIQERRRAHLRLGGIFINVRSGLTKSDFGIHMFCLQLCPLLLHLYIRIFVHLYLQ